MMDLGARAGLVANQKLQMRRETYAKGQGG